MTSSPRRAFSISFESAFWLCVRSCLLISYVYLSLSRKGKNSRTQIINSNHLRLPSVDPLEFDPRFSIANFQFLDFLEEGTGVRVFVCVLGEVLGLKIRHEGTRERLAFGGHIADFDL